MVCRCKTPDFVGSLGDFSREYETGEMGYGISFLREVEWVANLIVGLTVRDGGVGAYSAVMFDFAASRVVHADWLCFVVCGCVRHGVVECRGGRFWSLGLWLGGWRGLRVVEGGGEYICVAFINLGHVYPMVLCCRGARLPPGRSPLAGPKGMGRSNKCIEEGRLGPLVVVKGRWGGDGFFAARQFFGPHNARRITRLRTCFRVRSGVVIDLQCVDGVILRFAVEAGLTLVIGTLAFGFVSKERAVRLDDWKSSASNAFRCEEVMALDNMVVICRRVQSVNVVSNVEIARPVEIGDELNYQFKESWVEINCVDIAFVVASKSHIEKIIVNLFICGIIILYCSMELVMNATKVYEEEPRTRSVGKRSELLVERMLKGKKMLTGDELTISTSGGSHLRFPCEVSVQDFDLFCHPANRGSLLARLAFRLQTRLLVSTVVLVGYFINNDLEYLKGIEDMVPSLWSPVKVAYDRYDVWGITHWGYLEEIEVRKEDQKLYKFKEGDFPRFNLRNIEDILLLLVQNKISNLERDVIYDLNVALRMFTRHVVILKRVEDIQLGVESYQKKLNQATDIQYKRNRLMRSDELYKFSDGTLTFVRSVLHDIASNLRMDYLPKRRWSNLDRQRSRIMIKAIDKLKPERRLMRSLEKFVGGRDYGDELRLLEWTI
ncbi:hypothetical protein Tco_1247254 [Tanacetum coccineum]